MNGGRRQWYMAYGTSSEYHIRSAEVEWKLSFIGSGVVYEIFLWWLSIGTIPSIVHVGFMFRECDREVLDLVSFLNSLLQKQKRAKCQRL